MIVTNELIDYREKMLAIQQRQIALLEGIVDKLIAHAMCEEYNELRKYSPDQPRDWRGRWTNSELMGYSVDEYSHAQASEMHH